MKSCFSVVFFWISLFSNFIFNFWMSTDASANVGEAYGFGSRTAALGGAGVAWGTDAFATYFNPAQLALPSDKRLQLGYGQIYMQPNFTPIRGVVTQNTFISDSQQTGDVD